MLPGVNHCHLPDESNQHQLDGYFLGIYNFILKSPYLIFESDHLKFLSRVVIAGHTEVNSYSAFGIGSLLRNNLKLAQGTYTIMDSCIIHNTEAWRVNVDNPAKMVEGKNSMNVS